MHLGRFHAVIYDLSTHFKDVKLKDKIEKCATAVEQYASSPTEAQVVVFRAAYEDLLKATEISDPDLKQPFAEQVIEGLKLQDLFAPKLSKSIKDMISQHGFDHSGLAKALRNLGSRVSDKISQIDSIESSFKDLNVEFERIDKNESEVGVLLPREVVGESLSLLSREFANLGILAKAINELTSASDYDPKIKTISSSWWQVFLQLDSVQILVWVAAIERIMNMYKTTLEIKHLQQQLASKDVSSEIVDLLEKEIDKKISQSMKVLASELREEYAKIDDKGRLNEIESQLSIGLKHLAMRISQGAQIEINVGVPDDPKAPSTENMSEEQVAESLKVFEDKKIQIQKLRELGNRGRAISVQTLGNNDTPQSFLKHFSSESDGSENNHS